ncbi:MAG TPA: hypothetical protein VGZ00_09840 [Candidatus Baltobacteraceae bacterium]|jgi:hypothetical protein|nr:hypothetical protein [Candidatus Baltobacteraceae bacterium]
MSHQLIYFLVWVSLIIILFWSSVRVSKAKNILGQCGYAILCILFCFGVLFFIPEVNFPFGEWEAYRFGSQLVVGMTADQVETLRKQTFGDDTGTLNSTLKDNYYDKNVSRVWYMGGGMFCLTWGPIYRLEYDPSGVHLKAWKRGDWFDGC